MSLVHVDRVSSGPGWQLGEGLTLDHSILGCLRLPLNGIKSRRKGCGGGGGVCQTKAQREGFLLRPKTLAALPDQLFSNGECGDVQQRLRAGT